MEITKIKLSDHYDIKSNAYVEIIRPTAMLDGGEITNLPALVICPGGGYGMISKREGEPVALEFLARGYVTAILNYSTVTTAGKSSYPMQLNELMASVDHLVCNYEEYGLDPEKIFVMGFSAGGHLVCNLGAEYKKQLSRYTLKIKGVCLAYPVISSEYGPAGDTYNNLLRDYGEKDKQELMSELSFNKADLSDFPPAFIWTTNTDELVSPLNAISLIENLSKHGRACEFHLFPKGPHGLSTASTLINNPLPELSRVDAWMDMCDNFFKGLE